MIDDLLLDHARRLWVGLAGAAVEFGVDGVDVGVAPSSQLCPPGWVGIVALAGNAAATAPDKDSAEVVRRGLSGLTVAELTEPDAVRERLPVEDVLGPATLAYCDTESFRPWKPGDAERLRLVRLGPRERREADNREDQLGEWTNRPGTGESATRRLGFRVGWGVKRWCRRNRSG
ncbi:hypothetical protein M1L60_09400 [Actinoplanes sp. TRM 88003]|uniref:Uncharacterized protein n=1 Tax=Paractinoplanes aksuensis TaxID=2939490 RepID=A0ABT1DIZ5_9ACTN|nr:hypothetical protein [Actinoplanes aksuensis]MCO8270807.1 hypothetical protein [Actinoplanes aksuensis]